VPSATNALWSLFLATVLSVAIVLVALAAALILAQRRRLALHRDYARRLLTAQEDERARIAREVHDDALQRVALLRHELDDLAAAASTTAGDGGTVQRARALGAELEDLGVMLRQVAHQLHPSLVEQVGLATALGALGAEIERTTGIAVEVTLPNSDPRLPRDIALAAYRIAQEALRNVVKHAGAAKAALELATAPGSVTLRVRDEGRGLPAQRDAEHGLGLRAMRERAELVHGRLTVTSQPGRGTSVEVTLPTTGA
jgi:signal transduction histidine kinase